ncbi:glycoside hydrolase family 25 protein [Lawsonella clevelandensis]|uniref:glycoside hydrolase family 25 protein n=1 Tax=Lawsonella clevelandensis TaxID=1528099 RepID=UPI0009E9E125|nr:glycoside hydrolase family 25 protein [Lawsonella clevelandensis]
MKTRLVPVLATLGLSSALLVAPLTSGFSLGHFTLALAPAHADTTTGNGDGIPTTTTGANGTAATSAGTVSLPDPVAVTVQPEVPYDEMPNGIDIASWQHPNGADVDFKRVQAAGYTYVFVKATEGTHYKNEYYVNDAMAAQGNGVLMGGYHYADVSKDARAQAAMFADTISVKGGTSLPPVLDIEEAKGLSAAQLNVWVRAFLQETYNRVGLKPIIYSYRSFLMNQMGNTPDFSGFPLWIADYNGSQSPTLPLPGGWKTWTFWQYSSQTQIDGVQAQRVDANKFGGTMLQLRVFAATGVVPAEQK